jgi:hypothetical protein
LQGEERAMSLRVELTNFALLRAPFVLWLLYKLS